MDDWFQINYRRLANDVQIMAKFLRPLRGLHECGCYRIADLVAELVDMSALLPVDERHETSCTQ